MGMFKNSIKRHLENIPTGFVVATLFIYGFLIRFPFFFRDYIDRDESTFIIMGQSWVDGYLPYTELWDIKPPLTFLFFASVIYLFGKSFIAIRLFGVVLVTISSYFCYKLSKNISSKQISLGVGLLSVILQSLFGSLQGVMSEHIVMSLLTPALWILTLKKHKNKHWLFAGILMGSALMVKLNVAYVALAIGLYALFQKTKRKDFGKNLKHAIFYGCGVLIIIGATVFPYYLDDKLPLWWNSVIIAPLAYAGERQDSILKTAFFIVPLLAFLGWGYYKKHFSVKNRTTTVLVLAVIGSVLAFIKGGRINGHYLILLYPILLPLIALVVNNTFRSWHRKTSYVVILLLILIPMESYLEYVNIGKNKIEKGSFFNGEGVDVPKYFEENGLEAKNILFTEYHIGYWLLDQKPPTKAATQPSNILKDEMFFAYDNPRKTGKEELRHILDNIQPKHIVVRKGRRVFDKKDLAVNFYLNITLQKKYTVLDTIDQAIIYQRLE